MKSYRISVLLTACLLAVILVASVSSPVCAQGAPADSVLMNYQGLLTDPGGSLLNGTFDLTFKLYSAAGSVLPIWTEAHTAVPVSNGRIMVDLGSRTRLSSALLANSGRYLGVTIGNDAEMYPRTMLMSVPRAATSQKLAGDILTDAGKLFISDDNGDTTIAIAGRGDNFSIKMFDPQPEPPKLYVNLEAVTGQGPKLDLFNQAGQVMGVEPSPFNTGFSLRMFDPQPEPPRAIVDISTEFSQQGAAMSPEEAGAGTIRMYGLPDGGTNQEMVHLEASGWQAFMRMGLGTPDGNTARYIDLSSNGSESTIDISGPDGATAARHIVLKADYTGAWVGIGTETPTQALQVNGNICYTGTIGACSDAAFKKDIEPIDNALEAIDEMNGVRYSLKTDEFPEYHFSSERQVGVIAQEVKEAVPEAVTLQSDGYYTVDYSRLTPVLLEAVKELKKQNEELSKRLEALEAERSK